MLEIKTMDTVLWVCGQYCSLFDQEVLSVDFKSVCNHFNLSAARVEQIIVIYLIEN